MKTKTINLYEYQELSEEAKKKALRAWREDGIDEYLFQVLMDDHLATLLERNGVERATTDHPQIYYSLSYSQGDGAMFIGTFKWKGRDIAITQCDHHYCHSHTASIVETDENGEETDPPQDFVELYHNICKDLEAFGYNTIEELESEERFIEEGNANEWTFREDGRLEV